MPLLSCITNARRLLKASAMLHATMCEGQPAWRRAFSDKPDRLVMPNEPGGWADFAARLIADA